MIKPLRESLIRLTGKRERYEIMQRLALDGILREVGVNVALHPGGWAASASLLCTVARIVTELPIKNVLELGCGQTTILLAALKETMDFKLTTIEHDAGWAELITKNSGHEVDLAALTFDGNGYVLNDLPGPFDLIIVDGPPGTGTKWSRGGAVSIAEQHMANPCVVVVDDTHRRGEAATASAIAEWQPSEFKTMRGDGWHTVIAAPQWGTMARSLV